MMLVKYAQFYSILFVCTGIYCHDSTQITKKCEFLLLVKYTCFTVMYSIR